MSYPMLLGWAKDVKETVQIITKDYHDNGLWSSVYDDSSAGQCIYGVGTYQSSKTGSPVGMTWNTQGIRWTKSSWWSETTWVLNVTFNIISQLKITKVECDHNATQNPLILVCDTFSNNNLIWDDYKHIFMRGTATPNTDDKIHSLGSGVSDYTYWKGDQLTHLKNWESNKKVLGDQWGGSGTGSGAWTQKDNKGMTWVAGTAMSPTSVAGSGSYTWAVPGLGQHTTSVDFDTILTDKYDTILNELPNTVKKTVGSNTYMLLRAGLPVIEVKNGDSYKITLSFDGSSSTTHYVFPSFGPMLGAYTSWSLVDLTGKTKESTGNCYRFVGNTAELNFQANTNGFLWLKWSDLAQAKGGGTCKILTEIEHIKAN